MGPALPPQQDRAVTGKRGRHGGHYRAESCMRRVPRGGDDRVAKAMPPEPSGSSSHGAVRRLETRLASGQRTFRDRQAEGRAV